MAFFRLAGFLGGTTSSFGIGMPRRIKVGMSYFDQSSSPSFRTGIESADLGRSQFGDRTAPDQCFRLVEDHVIAKFPTLPTASRKR